MRWSVVVLLDLLASGMTNEEILEEPPELEREDILTVLQHVGLLAGCWARCWRAPDGGNL